MKNFKIPKELQIAIVIIFFSLLTYYLVEPFAHSQMHKYIEGNNFNYDGQDDISEVINDDKLKKEKEIFWSEINKLSKQQASVKRGKIGFSVCSSCHNGASVAIGGVIPPNLDHAGYIYDKKYLIALLKDPVMASNTNHKFKNHMNHPMASAYSMIGDDQKVLDIVAYLLEQKAKVPTPKKAFEEACSRCHSMRYAKTTILGETPKFKLEKNTLAYRIKILKAEEELKKYLGNIPPDLSSIIRARTHHYLKTFIENPQSQIKFTAMPRVGLTEDAFNKVEEYLTEVGDQHKEDREKLGIWVILFFFIFTILAYMWKQEKWRDV